MEELKDFCRRKGLPTGGGKAEVTQRVAHYIDTGEVLRPQGKQAPKRALAAPVDEEFALNSLIEPGIKCSERHRAFFKQHIGKGFSFNVAFQTWLKENAGKTYADAIATYREIKEKGKSQQTVIGKQFEYNTYVWAYFADNPGSPLQDAIRCWKYKKSRPGHNRYEKEDRAALEKSP